jgi:hypothetical protein
MGIDPALYFVCRLSRPILLIKSENANASNGTADVNGFTNEVVAWSMMFLASQ